MALLRATLACIAWRLTVRVRMQRHTAAGTYHAMQVVHAHDELLEEPACFALLQPSFSHDVLKHVASRYVLHCNGQVSGGHEHLCQAWLVSPRRACISCRRRRHCWGRWACLFELHNVGVHEHPVIEDLSLHILGHLFRR